MKPTSPPAVLAVAIAAIVAACATSTSPTGRKQYVGAVSQEQLNQTGRAGLRRGQGQAERLSTDARTDAYVRCVVNEITRELPPSWQSELGNRGVRRQLGPTHSHCPAARSA